MGFKKGWIKMSEEELEARLRELIQKIANLPPDQKDKLESTIKETGERQKQIKEDISKVTDKLADTLTSLRILLKYTMFDLEATRRERDKFKAMLENRPPDDDSPHKTNGEI